MIPKIEWALRLSLITAGSVAVHWSPWFLGVVLIGAAWVYVAAKAKAAEKVAEVSIDAQKLATLQKAVEDLQLKLGFHRTQRGGM